MMPLHVFKQQDLCSIAFQVTHSIPPTELLIALQRMPDTFLQRKISTDYEEYGSASQREY